MGDGRRTRRSTPPRARGAHRGEGDDRRRRNGRARLPGARRGAGARGTRCRRRLRRDRGGPGGALRSRRGVPVPGGRGGRGRGARSAPQGGGSLEVVPRHQLVSAARGVLRRRRRDGGLRERSRRRGGGPVAQAGRPPRAEQRSGAREPVARPTGARRRRLLRGNRGLVPAARPDGGDGQSGPGGDRRGARPTRDPRQGGVEGARPRGGAPHPPDLRGQPGGQTDQRCRRRGDRTSPRSLGPPDRVRGRSEEPRRRPRRAAGDRRIDRASVPVPGADGPRPRRRGPRGLPERRDHGRGDHVLRGAGGPRSVSAPQGPAAGVERAHPPARRRGRDALRRGPDGGGPGVARHRPARRREAVANDGRARGAPRPSGRCGCARGLDRAGGGRVSDLSPYVPPAGSIPTLEVPSLEGIRRAHLIGIGGAGMRGIARILLARGLAVSGSDLKTFPGDEDLREAGATISVGHDASNLGDVDAVVVSSAIPASNPELVAARERNLPVYARAQILAALATGARAFAVAGTHGKTTTTSMLAVILARAGLDPTYVVGGDLNESGSGARSGTGDAFVLETDESDGSFLLFRPEVGIVTNVEEDHLDFYADAG